MLPAIHFAPCRTHHSRYHTLLPTKHYQWLHHHPAWWTCHSSTVHLPTSAGSQVAGVTTLARPVPGPLGSLADQQVHTPLQPSEFERELRNHRDKAWVTWLLNSIQYGVSISFNGPHTPCTARNLPQPSSIRRWLALSSRRRWLLAGS